MNNKSLIILLVLAVFLVTGCKETHNKAIDLAYHLTATAPDSALSVLNGVNQALPEPMLINYEPWLDSFESRFCLLNKFSYEIFCFLFLSMYVHFAN